MSFDIAFVVPRDKPVPSPSVLERAVLALPNIQPAEEPELLPDQVISYLWKYEYLNLETSVSFTLTLSPASSSLIAGQGKDVGLVACIPTRCPTFVARECMPIIEQLARTAMLDLYLPSGDYIESQKCSASSIQLAWQTVNRMTTIKSAVSKDFRAHYFPQEQLDEMWRYLNARQVLLKRYSAMGIYVPRVILINNKLDRNQLFRAMMWSDLEPTVVPQVDAYVISKPAGLFLNRFPHGAQTPVIVRSSVINEIIDPFIRLTQRPIPHNLLEDTSEIRLPIYRAIKDLLQPPFQNFETVTVDDIVDVQE